MSSPPPPDRAALGRARLAARARRIAQLRRRVAAAALTTFALALGRDRLARLDGRADDHADRAGRAGGRDGDADRHGNGHRDAHRDGHGHGHAGPHHISELMHLFWITSRAAGYVALLASTAAVALGLLMSTRLRRGADLKPLHEALGLATMAALAVHALALLGDSYLKPSLADVTVPFVSGYMRGWTTTGIVAGWMMIALGLSYYARGRIGPARWRSLHRLTALAWVLGIVHTLGEGSDAGAAWFLLTAGALVLPTAALLARRLAPA